MTTTDPPTAPAHLDELLREAATVLSNPYLCNFPNEVARELARLLRVHANLIEGQREAGVGFTEVFAISEVKAVADAVLRMVGEATP